MAEPAGDSAAGRAGAGEADAGEADAGAAGGNGGRGAEERDAREVHRLLRSALTRLQRHPFVQVRESAGSLDSVEGPGRSASVATSKYAISPVEAEEATNKDADDATAADFTAFTDLLYRLRDAHRASIYANRCSDDEGPRRVFGFLASPGSHEVTLQTHEVDIVFHDEPSPAERCGVIRCTTLSTLCLLCTTLHSAF